MLQVYLICDLIEKIIPYYAEHNPESLSNFNWVVDQKGAIRNKYEKFFQYIYISLISCRSISKSFPIMKTKTSNYQYFFEYYKSKNNKDKNLDIVRNI